MVYQKQIHSNQQIIRHLVRLIHFKQICETWYQCVEKKNESKNKSALRYTHTNTKHHYPPIYPIHLAKQKQTKNHYHSTKSNKLNMSQFIVCMFTNHPTHTQISIMHRAYRMHRCNVCRRQRFRMDRIIQRMIVIRILMPAHS